MLGGSDPTFPDYSREYLLKTGETSRDIDLSHTWTYDGIEHVDPKKQADAQNLKLANLTTNLKIECAKDGRNYETVMKQAVAELKMKQV